MSGKERKVMVYTQMYYLVEYAAGLRRPVAMERLCRLE